MTLSKQVETSLDEAVASLRNALAFAARNEEPYISKHIADVMFQIENLKNVSNVLAMSEKIMKDLEEENEDDGGFLKVVIHILGKKRVDIVAP